MEGGREGGRGEGDVDYQWLVELVPKFFRAADPHKLTKVRREGGREGGREVCVE